METRVGPYRILRLIDHGGQGRVYLGYDQRLQRRVAIKTQRLPASRSERRRCLREARLVAALDSPKIVRIHDVVESRDHLALVMEYVPGIDLEQFLQARRADLASVITVGIDLAGALAAARQQRLVHGDIKAANVLITTRGRAKLADFGIAREQSWQRQAMQPGSLTALTPEQLLGRAADHKSDLFALGCLLYRMLAGSHPFVTDGSLDRERLLAGSPEPLSSRLGAGVELPVELEALIGDLLRPEPADRPRGTHRVRSVLRNAGRGIPLSARDSLLVQAGPLFRPESPEDIPPAVPRELTEAGRSTLAVSGWLGWWRRSWLAGSRRPMQIGAVLGLFAVVAVTSALVLGRWGTQTRVHIPQPVMEVASLNLLPRGLSTLWLVEEVKAAVAGEIGSILVSGPVGATPATTLYLGDDTGHRQPPAAETLELALRCSDDLCVLDLRRSHRHGAESAQVVVLPRMSMEHWSSKVRAAARALYP